MSKRLDADIQEWARSMVAEADKSNLSAVNIVEKILRDPGMASGGSRDRVHWWPKNRRIAKISRLMHRIDETSQLCLIIDSGVIFHDDGRVFKPKDLKDISSLSVGDIRNRIRAAKLGLRAFM